MCFKFRLSSFFSPCCRRHHLTIPSPDAVTSSDPSFWRVALPLPVLTTVIPLCPRPFTISVSHPGCHTRTASHPVRWLFSSLSATFLRLSEIRCYNPFSSSCPSPCSHRNGHKLGGGPDRTASHQPVTCLSLGFHHAPPFRIFQKGNSSFFIFLVFSLGEGGQSSSMVNYIPLAVRRF